MKYKIDWSKITDNVSVNCRTEEEMKMLVGAAICEKDLKNKGSWDGHGTEWYIYANETCCSIVNNRLEYSGRPWYERKGFTILPFSDILILIQDPERNQTAKADNGKLMLELIPPETYIALGEILTYGANKYSPENWKTVKPERYIGALLRHLTAYMQDPSSVDEESGYSHIKHVLCNAAFLEWLASQTTQNGGTHE